MDWLGVKLPAQSLSLESLVEEEVVFRISKQGWRKTVELARWCGSEAAVAA